MCISGVCQPISKNFGGPLPVWGNPNLIFMNVLGAFHRTADCNYEHSAHGMDPWLSNQPNNGNGINEDCVVHDGKWNDVPCDKKTFSICEST